MSFLNYNNQLYPDSDLLFGAGNRAFRFGEGLIETMLWRKGQVRFFNDHVERLAVSLTTLNWPAFPLSAHQLQKAIGQLVQSNMLQDDHMIRLQVFRGADETPLHFLLECLPLPTGTTGWPEKGLHIGLSQRVVKTADSLANLKTTSRLNYSIAAAEAAQQGWDDILITNPSGQVAESSISNIFWITAEGIYTPPLSSGCIAGIMRKKLLQAGSLAGLSIQERITTADDLINAEELLLSNAIRGIQPVSSFNNKTYPNLITRNLFNQFDTL